MTIRIPSAIHVLISASFLTSAILLFTKSYYLNKLFFIILSFLLIFLCLKKQHKNILPFLTLYFIAELVSEIPFFSTAFNNSIYILSYTTLNITIYKKLNPKKAWYALKLSIAILITTSLVLLFKLNTIVFNAKTPTLETFIDVIYNVSILLLLSISLLHFLHKSSLKSLSYFLLSACFVFSEITQLAYVRTEKSITLFLALTILKLLGFLFCYNLICIKSDKSYFTITDLSEAT